MTAGAPPGRRALRGRRGGEAGSVLVETVALSTLVIMLILVLVEVCLAGYTAILATHAARSGARALVIGENVTEAVEREVPAGWRGTLTVHEGSDWVEVEVGVPFLVLGEGSLARVTGFARMEGPDGGDVGAER